MSTITKEWLQQKISEMESRRYDPWLGLDEDESNTLAALRIALAVLTAEPAKCGHVNVDCDDGKALCLSCGKVWEV
nr:MAG TPA: zinc ribbon domain protein [Caudoviricetes sp.]